MAQHFSPKTIQKPPKTAQNSPKQRKAVENRQKRTFFFEALSRCGGDVAAAAAAAAVAAAGPKEPSLIMSIFSLAPSGIIMTTPSLHFPLRHCLRNTNMENYSE